MTDSYAVIDTQAAYDAAIEALASASGPVAVDVERASGFRYSQRAYLVQVFRRGAGTYLIDAPAFDEHAALQGAIGDAEWVFHAASQDLPSLREIGLVPREIFDTELTARLLGWPKVGLAAVTERTVGIELKKEHSAADWSTRPLPDAWLEYAALDVEYLLDVRDREDEALAEAGKSDWARAEFEHVRTLAPKPPRQEPWRRLSGLHAVRGRRALAVARELWTAREEYARERDVSPGRLLPDRAIVAAVLAGPTSRSALAGLKAFTGRASRTQIDRWWNAMAAGRASDDLPTERAKGESAFPPPKAWRDRNPEADRRLKLSRAAIAERADELELPAENLLTPDLLRRIAWQPPADAAAEGIGAALRDLGARDWQAQETAPAIAGAFVRAAQPAADDDEAAS